MIPTDRDYNGAWVAPVPEAGRTCKVCQYPDESVDGSGYCWFCRYKEHIALMVAREDDDE